MNEQERPDPYLPQRIAMVETQLRNRGIRDPRVLQAMEQVPRHFFVRQSDEKEAYSDNPLPIGAGQTISQPYIVAAMLEALQLMPDERVLEIGTGSGYEAAILGELVREVYTIERQAELAKNARLILEKLEYKNLMVVLGDGTQGLAEYAPYDAIVVSAAAPHVPIPLFEQLREGGRMVIPVGDAAVQELQLVRKLGGEAVVSHLDGCRFVPLLGTAGFPPA